MSGEFLTGRCAECGRPLPDHRRYRCERCVSLAYERVQASQARGDRGPIRWHDEQQTSEEAA